MGYGRRARSALCSVPEGSSVTIGEYGGEAPRRECIPATVEVRPSDALAHVLNEIKVQALEALRAGRWNDAIEWCQLANKIRVA